MRNETRCLTIAPLLLAAAVAGCARAPEYSVSARGAIPGPQTSYRLVQPEGEPPSLPADVETVLAAALEQRGLVKAATAAKPDLILFAALARRPAKVGDFTRDNPGDSAEAPDWIAQPDRRGRQVTTLALRFVNPATGAEVRSVRAEARHGRRSGDVVIAPLIDGAANGQIPAPVRR